MWSHIRSWALAVTLAGCMGGNNTVPKPQLQVNITADTQSIEAEQQVGLKATVQGTGASGAQISWSAEAGSFIKTMGSEVQQTAPSNKGTYEITAQAASDKTVAKKSIEMTVTERDTGEPDPEPDPDPGTVSYGDVLEFTADVSGVESEAVTMWNATGASYPHQRVRKRSGPYRMKLMSLK